MPLFRNPDDILQVHFLRFQKISNLPACLSQGRGYEDTRIGCGCKNLNHIIRVRYGADNYPAIQCYAMLLLDLSLEGTLG